jgi:hypothetical protein
MEKRSNGVIAQNESRQNLKVVKEVDYFTGFLRDSKRGILSG